MRYRYIGDHADTTGSGQPLGIGDYVELSDDEAKDPHNASLIESGQMIEAPEESKSKSTSKKEAS
jgi:hypothetical protein